MARQATRVEVITCEEGADGYGVSNGQSDQVTIVRLPAGCRKWQWLPRCNGYYREIRTRLRSAGCCLVHDTGLWLASNHACAAAARFLHLPLVISPRGMLSPWAMRFHGAKKRLAWIAYQRRDLASAALLHATSEQEATELRAHGLKQPIAIIPNGVEVPEADRNLDDDARTGRAGGRVILFLSRIHPKKGLLDLVHAWHELRPVGWRVVIGGGDAGEHRLEVERVIQRYGLAPQFQFLGQVEDSRKWQLYRSADLFVLPSRSENFGLVIAEALACGTPVVTTVNTPWKDLAECGCGWWIEPNQGALAGALREALALTDSERRRMGEKGRRLIQSKYAWSRAGVSMRAVYEWLLGLGPKPVFVI